MVECTPILDALAHLLLIGGIALLCLPVYLAFVAASLDGATVNSVPMPLLPGGELGANLATVWTRADLGRSSSTPR